MTSFRQYLEGKFRRTGGAFGKESGGWDLSGDRGQYSMDRINADIENKHNTHAARVSFGKKKEAIIIEALKNIGWIVRPASPQEDMVRHIDAWIKKTEDSAETPVQIKYRDSGDDILMEVIKFWSGEMFTRPLTDMDFNGRDMSGSAVLYVVLNQARDMLRIRRISEAKDIAKKMTEMLAVDYKMMGKRNLNTRTGTIRITPDPATGRDKVMAYINPDAFNNKQDLPTEKPLW
jgi:hypothetical protein